MVLMNADKDLARAGGKVYRDVQPVLDRIIAPDHAVEVAFPSMVVRSDIRTECLVVLTDSQVVVAWRKGALKKQVDFQAIPRHAISKATVGRGRGSLRGALLLTIRSDGPECIVGLPEGPTAFTEHLITLLTTKAQGLEELPSSLIMRQPLAPIQAPEGNASHATSGVSARSAEDGSTAAAGRPALSRRRIAVLLAVLLAFGVVAAGLGARSFIRRDSPSWDAGTERGQELQVIHLTSLGSTREEMKSGKHDDFHKEECKTWALEARKGGHEWQAWSYGDFQWSAGHIAAADVDVDTFTDACFAAIIPE